MPAPRASDSMISLRYEETLPAKPPIPVTVAPPRAPPTDMHPALRRTNNDMSDEDGWKRDSGLAPTTSSKAREGSVNTVEENNNAPGLGLAASLSASASVNSPALKVHSAPETPAKTLPEVKVTKGGSLSLENSSRWRRPSSSRSSKPKTPPTIARAASVENFTPITTSIPTDSLLEEDFLNKLSFSKRGSVMLGGKKAVNRPVRTSVVKEGAPSFSLLVSPSSKVLADEVEMESQRVRAMYETGMYLEPNSARSSAIGSHSTLEEELGEQQAANGLLSPAVDRTAFRPGSAMSTKSESAIKLPHELAGGIEDWEDVQGAEVDRYGFISLRKDPSRSGTPEPKPPQRVSTALQLASEAPRKKRVFGRTPSVTSNTRGQVKRSPTRKLSAPSLRSQNTGISVISRRSHFRAAANRLPGNRDRRWMDEAGDMLTLPPGLADIAEDAEGGRAADSQKRREWERAEKWRRMATVVKTPKNGEGMEFEFDVRNPKLIERTWKGIPDIWRAAAWHSFLTTSARKKGNCATDEQIVEAFHRLQDQSSADDVQIDIDVPRTINSHIMFRRRYRGGQRLLFRVLHALSLYFPNTGYVQGMASLAATLLCYYDEDKTFIMLVRMWTLRGLDKLYESGFSGLMAALDEFHTQWLDGDEVTDKLVSSRNNKSLPTTNNLQSELSIEPTAYGTRWYLTLFNYSIPFQAQLRVWDVFMLLGDADPAASVTPERPFAGGLDVLHATSAALIDGTREILLDSDFENAMKVLTSWIPVKDEELLMKVTKAEWKLHHGKRRN
jgi:hypothetical protein